MVTALYPPSVGGIQTQTEQLSKALAAKGQRVFVITRRVAGAPDYEESNNVVVHRVGKVTESRAVGTGAFMADAVRTLIKLRGKVQVLHCHQLLSPLSIGLIAKPLLGAKLVLNPHACGPIGDVEQLKAQSLFGRARLSGALRSADSFVAISRPIENELRSIGVDDRRLWRVPNGVDLKRFRPATRGERAQLRAELSLPVDAKIVLYCGRLAQEKGVDVLINAWPDVAKKVRGAVLCIAGDGAEKAALMELAQQLGVAESVRFLGALSDPAPYLRAADAAVLPSRTEGLPVALLESMACGLPTVATNVGGTPEVIDESMGVLVPPENPKSLSEGLVDALVSPLFVIRAERARQRIEARFSMDAVSERLIHLYEQLVHQSERSKQLVASSSR